MCADCTQREIQAAHISPNSPAARTKQGTKCTVAGTGAQSLSFSELSLGAGEVVGILLAFYVVLHCASYLALSRLHKQKR